MGLVLVSRTSVISLASSGRGFAPVRRTVVKTVGFVFGEDVARGGVFLSKSPPRCNFSVLRIVNEFSSCSPSPSTSSPGSSSEFLKLTVRWNWIEVFSKRSTEADDFPRGRSRESRSSRIYFVVTSSATLSVSAEDIFRMMFCS